MAMEKAEVETRASDPLPDLDDIMGEGVGLTDALAFWSSLANTPVDQRADWRQELSFWRDSLRRSAQGSS